MHGQPLRCLHCGQRIVADAVPVYLVEREEGWRAMPERVLVIGCIPCLRRTLLRGIASMRHGALPLSWLLWPWALCVNLVLWLALPRITPTMWLREALAHHHIPNDQVLTASFLNIPDLNASDAQRFGQAIVVLMRSVAAADGLTDQQEWNALRSYLRFLYSEDLAMFQRLDPGTAILPAPSRPIRLGAANWTSSTASGPASATPTNG